ncbi:MAG: glycosyl transferase family 2 [Anaeromyxobacter sp. RBG_16_69_14]|nr:MAG: glycosyl transferase family 2 [Anaeromyxobacter sp. RBG_16_69_14]
MRVLVIVPALNEAMSIASVIDSLRRNAPGCDVAVVDDGSTDGTAAIAASLDVVVLRSPINLGIGGAVQTGYLWARERGYDVAVQIDGDGQHEPRYIAVALALVERGEADLVVGSRFIEAGGFRSTALRRAGIRYLSWLLRLRCGARVTDPTSGFRVAGRRALELFADHYPSDYPEPESIAMAVRTGLRVREVAVRMRQREHGRSSINVLRTVYYLAKVSMALMLLPARARPAAAKDGVASS